MNENERIAYEFLRKIERTLAAFERLEAENTKLRELVVEMFNACPMCVNCAHNHLTVGWYDRMRELGVEADE